MSENYKETSLWNEAFSVRPNDPNGSARAYFSSAYDQFRANVTPLLVQIHKDLPDLTVHDISHIDALWQTCSTLAGADYKLNPAEAFVLGGCFLLHDAAMSLAAFPNRLDDLKKTVIWRDALAQCYRKDGTESFDLNAPTPPAYSEAATQTALRQLHAVQAEKLPFTEWENRYLLDDPDLREAYGELIGKLAHSHWWDIQKLSPNFARPKGAIALPPPKPQMPGDWIVDPLKIACLLRVADAAHIDARRAPAFLRRLTRPSGISQDHWFFQERMNQLYAREDTLFFTSGRSFPESHSDAWWLCFDAIQMVDSELRAVDALLLDTKRIRLACRKVAGAERPEDLSEFVQTSGWRPVDTRFKVSDVGHLARTLGGRQLYGEGWIRAPLREMIGNSADAIRARRHLPSGGLHASGGQIIVSVEKQDQKYLIKFQDDGVGMSADTLTNELIDFGKSFWKSGRAQSEWPGLLSTPFKPTGEFGIGFFSIFMWGEEVEIKTRRFDAAQNDGHALIFKRGLYHRPILRKLTANELPANINTSIEIKVDFDPFSYLPEQDRIGVFCKLTYVDGHRSTLPIDIDDALPGLCPTLDVDVYFKGPSDNQATKVISANYWEFCDTNEFKKLYEKVRFNSPHYYRTTNTLIHPDLLETVRDDRGKVLARIWPSWREPMLLSVGGFTVWEQTGGHFCFAGLCVAKVRTAARNSAELALSSNQLAGILEKKMPVLKNLWASHSQSYCSDFSVFSYYLLESELHPGTDAPICFNSSSYQSIASLKKLLGDERIIYLCNAYLADTRFDGDPENIYLSEDMLSLPKNTFAYFDREEISHINQDTGGVPEGKSIVIRYIEEKLRETSPSLEVKIQRAPIANIHGVTIYRDCHAFTVR